MKKLQHNRPCGFANLQKRRHHTVCHLRITGFDLMFQNRAGREVTEQYAKKQSAAMKFGQCVLRLIAPLL